MKHVFYKPREGYKYDKNGYLGIKILVLGESHYCGENCKNCGIKANNNCIDYTINTVENYIKYKKGDSEHEYWMNTFTRFANVMFGEKVSKDKQVELWDSVLFYNYVQSSTPGPRIKPTNEQFNNGAMSFFEVLELYQPDLIIVWGMRLWEKIPNNGEYGNEYLLRNSEERFYNYKINNKEIPALGIKHPSTYHLNMDYTKYIHEAIRIIKDKKSNE